MRYFDVRHSPIGLYQFSPRGANYADSSGNGYNTAAVTGFYGDLWPGLEGAEGTANTDAQLTQAAFALTGAMTLGCIIKPNAAGGVTNDCIIRYGGSAASETEANNTLWGAFLMANRMRWLQESGAGVSAVALSSVVALAHKVSVLFFRRRVVGADHFIDFFLDGKLRETSAALVAPTGGSTAQLRVFGSTNTGSGDLEQPLDGSISSCGIWGTALTDEQIAALSEYALQPELGPAPNVTRYRGTARAFWPMQNSLVTDASGNSRDLTWTRSPLYTSLHHGIDGVFLNGLTGVNCNALIRAADAGLQMPGDFDFMALVLSTGTIVDATDGPLLNIYEQVVFGTPSTPATPTDTARLIGVKILNGASQEFAAAVTNARQQFGWSSNATGVSNISAFQLGAYNGKWQVVHYQRRGQLVTVKINGTLTATFTAPSAPTVNASTITAIGAPGSATSGGFALARVGLFEALSAEHETVNTNLALGCDETPPVVSNRVPASAAVDILATAPVLFRAVDTETSVDELATNIYLDIDGAGEVAVMLNGVFQAGYSGGIVATAFGWDYTINHAVEFPPSAPIVVRIQVYDLMGNETEDTYTFTTAASIVSNITTVSSIGGTKIELLGVPAGRYRIHLGPNGDETDPLCFVGGGFGNVVTSDGVNPVELWTPQLPVGGPYAFYAVRVSGSEARTLLSEEQMTVVPYEYATGSFNLRRHFLPIRWLWTGPLKIEEDTDQ